MFKQIVTKRKFPLVNDYYEIVRKKARRIEFTSAARRIFSDEQSIQFCLNGIKFGLSEAGEEILHAIFVKRITNQTLIDHIMNKLKEFMMPEADIHGSAIIAAYVLSRIYAGQFVEDGSLFPYFQIEESNREFYAIVFARHAIYLGNDDARRFLSTAFSTGKRGCIQSSLSKWTNLNEALASSGCQSASLELGCYFFGVLPNGMKINELPHNLITIQLPYHKNKAKSFLLKAMKGSNIEIATLAIERFCDIYSDPAQLASFFKQEANGNPLIALYLAYAFCPVEFKPALSIELTPPSSFTKLFLPADTSELTHHYLLLALNGREKHLSQIAATFVNLFQKTEYPTFSTL